MDVDYWYDLSRYDTNFMGDILTLIKPKAKSSAEPATRGRTSSTSQNTKTAATKK